MEFPLDAFPGIRLHRKSAGEKLRFLAERCGELIGRIDECKEPCQYCTPSCSPAQPAAAEPACSLDWPDDADVNAASLASRSGGEAPH